MSVSQICRDHRFSVSDSYGHQRCQITTSEDKEIINNNGGSNETFNGTLLLTVGLLILTLMFSGAVNATNSREPGMEEVFAEGIPHPPVIISIKECKGDRSTPSKAEFLTDGIPHPATVQPPLKIL